ncbi:MAG: tetratricopeptide repeat protein [Gloeobacteraceae cyanobacterium ES-bin-316]|nr:tetratricopeptide repeat protein [Ferruginibacter sp.]
MKKIVSGSLVKFPLLFLVFYLFIAQVSFGQDCKTQAANKPSTSVRGTDDFFDFSHYTKKPAKWDITKMKLQLDKAESWIKNRLTGFTGAKLHYSNTYWLDYVASEEGYGGDVTFYKATGIKRFFSSKMRFYAYYCYDNSNTIHTEAESGSNVEVVFNNVFASGLTTDAGVYTVNGKPAFKTIQKKRSEGRIDFYEKRVQDNATAKMYTANDYIVLRNSDKSVFIPITRKEYLQQMLKDVETFGTKDTKLMTQVYTQNVKQFEAEMKAYKVDKNYTPEKEAKRRKWFEEDQEKLKIIISKTSPDTDASKEVILQYLKKPAAWLNRGFKSFYSYSTYTAEGVTQFVEDMDKSYLNGEEETQNEIVSINPAYFNNKLDAGVPQLITVHLPNGPYAHMLKVAALVKQSGALAPLEAMVNPDKSASTVLAPTEIVSNYSLNYLPKLKTLTPLTVPAGMKPSAIPVITNYNNAAPAAILNFTVPSLSAKLNQLPQLLTAESYTAYIQQLHNTISTAVKPNEKKKADDYVKNKKLNQSNQISSTAFAAWLQNAPAASLYLYSMAMATNPSDALAANNFSAFLIMGGLPEKSIPMLEYWNKQKPGEASILSNLGNAYYRLGDVDKAMKYLQQAVQKDSLHPTANKILCMMYLKKGDTKNAKDHGTRSLTGSHDEQVIAMLRQLDNKLKPGEIMSRLPVKEFPMLKRIKLPAMPSKLDDMGQFLIDLAAEKNSLEITIAAIESKIPNVSEDVQQKVLMASLTKGFSPLRVKAQYIIMDAMQTYQREMIRENDVFKYNMQLIDAPYSAKVKAINKKYAPQLNKLEGGEAGDEDEIAALEMAKCKDLNAEKEKYLGDLSKLVNGYAQRHEFVSRKFYADYANWAPYWMSETTIPFPSIERDYLKDVLGILTQYNIISKNNCTPFEPLPNKEGKLKEWEDEYCANFKGKMGMGPVKVFVTCTSWGVEGGEVVVGDFEVKYANDGSFEDLTIGAGFGETWAVGKENFAGIEASASIKEFIKFGKNKATNEWEVKDFGLKPEITLEGRLGKVSGEIKILEISASVNAGINVGGGCSTILNIFK